MRRMGRRPWRPDTEWTKLSAVHDHFFTNAASTVTTLASSSRKLAPEHQPCSIRSSASCPCLQMVTSSRSSACHPWINPEDQRVDADHIPQISAEVHNEIGRHPAPDLSTVLRANRLFSNAT